MADFLRSLAVLPGITSVRAIHARLARIAAITVFPESAAGPWSLSMCARVLGRPDRGGPGAATGAPRRPRTADPGVARAATGAPRRPEA